MYLDSLLFTWIWDIFSAEWNLSKICNTNNALILWIKDINAISFANPQSFISLKKRQKLQAESRKSTSSFFLVGKLCCQWTVKALFAKSNMKVISLLIPLLLISLQEASSRHKHHMRSSRVTTKKGWVAINPTIFNIIRWVAGAIVSSTKLLMIQV